MPKADHPPLLLPGEHHLSVAQLHALVAVQ